MLQMFSVGFLLVGFGGLICLAVATDPNERPSPQRQQLLPIGLALLFVGLGVLGSIFGLDYLGDALGSDVGLLGGLALLGGCGLSVICLGVIGFCIGRRPHRKLTH